MYIGTKDVFRPEIKKRGMQMQEFALLPVALLFSTNASAKQIRYFIPCIISVTRLIGVVDSSSETSILNRLVFFSWILPECI
jgi:hypothetical protein